MQDTNNHEFRTFFPMPLALIGTPFAGWVIDQTGGYRWTIAICFGCTCVSVALLTGLPVDASGRLERAPEARG